MNKKKTLKFKESLGIDIGTHSIKAVHLRKAHEGFRLLSCEVRPTVPSGIEYVPSDLRKDRFAPVLTEILKSMKLSPKHIKHLVTSIGGEDTSIKQIKTIFLPDEELESALFFEAKKHIPISSNEMVLDYQVLSIEEKTNNMNILLAAANKDLLNEHTEILTASGLTANIVDIDSLAIANSFVLNTLVEEGTYVLLNLGGHSTNMVIYGPQAKFFARDISYGGYHFTRDFMRRYNLTFEEAEQHKLDHGLSKPAIAGSAEALSMLDISEKTVEDQLVDEIRRSLRFYVKEANNSDFRKVYLLGGTAKLKGLAEYIQERINISTELYNPFASLEVSDRLADKKDPQLALAIGLAMREE